MDARCLMQKRTQDVIDDCHGQKAMIATEYNDIGKRLQETRNMIGKFAHKLLKLYAYAQELRSQAIQKFQQDHIVDFGLNAILDATAEAKSQLTKVEEYLSSNQQLATSLKGITIINDDDDRQT